MTLDSIADASVVLPEAKADPPAPAVSPAPKAATLAELKEACQGTPSDFLVAQLEAGATLPQASKAWMTELQTQNAALKKQAEKQPAPAPASAPKKPGAQPVPAADGGDEPAASGDALEAFDAAVREEMDRSKAPRHVAHLKVCNKQPELREAMVAAHNAVHNARNKPRR